MFMSDLLQMNDAYVHVEKLFNPVFKEKLGPMNIP